MSPKVSVVVPNYNHAPYLKTRIGSILEQTFQNFELILLDDCSPDGSADILRSYADNPHVACTDINTRNTGSPFAQWLKGIGRAKGEYVWLAESDDVASPHFLSVMSAVMDACPKASVAFCGSVLIDRDGNTLPDDIDRWTTRYGTPIPPYHIFNGKRYVERNLYWRNYIANASSALFRRDCFLRSGAEVCGGMRYSGDWLFWVLMAAQGDVVEVYDKLNLFRQHGQKVTVKADTTGEGRVEDAEILACMDRMLPRMGVWKRRVRHGILYNKVRKLPVPGADRQRLFRRLEERLGTGRNDGRLAHLNHWLRLVWPWAPTMKRDRLLP